MSTRSLLGDCVCCSGYATVCVSERVSERESASDSYNRRQQFERSCSRRQSCRESESSLSSRHSIPVRRRTMDILAAGQDIFRELQAVHDTGFLCAQPSLEEKWQQVSRESASARQHPV